MKFRIVFTPEARDDLVELYDYIAEHGNPERAIAYIERIEKACMSLQTLPNRGTLREDLRRGLRVMGFERRALIAFQVEIKICRHSSDFLRRAECGARIQALDKA